MAPATPPRSLLNAEGALDDQRQHGRHFGDVGEDDVDGHPQIGDGHERHDIFGDLGDLPDAAEDDDSRQHGERDPDPDLVDAEGALHGVGDRIGLDRVEDQPERDDEADREDDAGPGGVQAAGDIERRATAILAVVVGDLVKLRQRAFGIGGRHPDPGHDPHPEQRAGPAEEQRHGDAGEITGPDARGQAGAQRLERCDAAGVAFGRAQDRPEQFGKMSELDETEAEREEYADGDQAIDEDVAPEYLVQEIDNRVDRAHYRPSS